MTVCDPQGGVLTLTDPRMAERRGFNDLVGFIREGLVFHPFSHRSTGAKRRIE